MSTAKREAPVHNLVDAHHRLCHDLPPERRERVAGDPGYVTRAAADLAKAQSPYECLRHLYNELYGVERPMQNAVTRAAVSGGVMSDVLAARFGALLLEGYGSIPDTAKAFSRIVPLPSFLQAELVRVEPTTQLSAMNHRGGAAQSVEMAGSVGTWRLRRYAATLQVAEEDLLDDSFDAIGQVIREIGQASQRVKLDLLYSVLLSNPTMPDGVALFDAAGHVNLGSAVLAEADLDVALGAIGRQVVTDAEGKPIHLGLIGATLLVPPGLFGKGRRLARNMSLSDGQDLRVAAESRISAAGVVDPNTGEVTAGSDTAWYVLASAGVSATLLLGGLDGNVSPRVSVRPLTQGEWGLEASVNIDLAATAADWRPAYRSSP